MGSACVSPFFSGTDRDMCILFLHYCRGESDCSCPYLIIAANNRDESFSRPTAEAHFWSDHPHILAGRDLSEGGTWMGVSSRGRFAVLTNYRTHHSMIDKTATSRGHLVREFLCSESRPLDYCSSVLENGQSYNGFALITADLSGDGDLAYCSNRGSGQCQWVEPGVHGLSNHLLNTPWRKVERGKERMREIVATLTHTNHTREELTQQLLQLLSDDTCLDPDPLIPDTGFSEEWRKKASAIFVQPIGISEWTYGTRTSSVVLVGKDDSVTFTERTIAQPQSGASDLPSQQNWTTNSYKFKLNST